MNDWKSKLIFASIGVVVGWVGKTIYDRYKEEGKIDVEDLVKVKDGIKTVSSAANAVSNISREVRLS